MDQPGLAQDAALGLVECRQTPNWFLHLVWHDCVVDWDYVCENSGARGRSQKIYLCDGVCSLEDLAVLD